MHDGSLEDLNQVIDHYAHGGKIHPNKSQYIKSFDIDQKEKDHLIDFFNSLTDSAFLLKKY